jgi:hypothetical protein
MLDIKYFLENSVYYPACHFDGTPIKILGKIFSYYVYSDYNVKHDDLEENINKYGLKGYKLKNSCLIEANTLFGINWETYFEENRKYSCNLSFSWKNPFAKLYSFERYNYLDDKHGKNHIELLYIKSEGISAYKYLYINREIVPQCLVSIVPGLAFGGNFDDYPKVFMDTILSFKKLPNYQFYDDPCSEYFYDLIKHYELINEFNSYRSDYSWCSHFRFSKLIN